MSDMGHFSLVQADQKSVSKAAWPFPAWDQHGAPGRSPEHPRITVCGRPADGGPGWIHAVDADAGVRKWRLKSKPNARDLHKAAHWLRLVGWGGRPRGGAAVVASRSPPDAHLLLLFAFVAGGLCLLEGLIQVVARPGLPRGGRALGEN